jgi:hypothetical protein
MIAQFFFHISALERQHLIGLFIVLCLLLSFSLPRPFGLKVLYAVNKPAPIPKQGVSVFSSLCPNGVFKTFIFFGGETLTSGFLPPFLARSPTTQ